QKRQCGRCDPVNATSLSDGARPDGGELLTYLVREALDQRIVDLVGQCETLVAAECGDVGGLPGEIDVVLGVDLQLLKDLRRERVEARPDALQHIDPDGREREELERAAALTVAVQSQTVTLCLVRRERD